MLDAVHPAALFANGIGDHLLVLPAFRALCSLFPGRLTLICLPGAHRLFFADLDVRTVCEIDVHAHGDGQTRGFDPERVAAAIDPPDLLLSLNPWHSPSMGQLLGILGVTRSIGFHQDFSVCLPLDFQLHSADLSFQVPRSLDPTLCIERFARPPLLPQSAIRNAQQLLAGVPTGMRILTVHADTGMWRNRSTKMWPRDRFLAVLDSFLLRHKDFLVFVLGTSDQRLDVGQHGNRVIPCYGLPLETSFAIVDQADLFLGVDSCLLHVADLFRVPGVALFGPTDYREFGFRFGPHRHVSFGDSMADIDVNAVLDALESLAPMAHARHRLACPIQSGASAAREVRHVL